MVDDAARPRFRGLVWGVRNAWGEWAATVAFSPQKSTRLRLHAQLFTTGRAFLHEASDFRPSLRASLFALQGKESTP